MNLVKIMCDKCGAEMMINPGPLLASITSEKRRAASIINGRKGGRPKGSKNKKQTEK
jgi:hypothetical protein